MKTSVRGKLVLPFALCLAAPGVFGGSCIISGSVASVSASSLASSPAAVRSSTQTSPSAARSLEARFRTWLASLGIGIDPQFAPGFLFLIH